ncbi:MAG: hypothetical protein AAF579_14745 [Cyanobacteria bacterium P01_C01_bin.118]
MVDSPALRSQSTPEGFTYVVLPGILDVLNINDSLWTLFIPNDEAQSCTLIEYENALVDSGSVTQRQLE